MVRHPFLKLATNGQSDNAFLLTSAFCPQRLSAPAPGVYTCGKTLKMCIKSEFKEICLKLTTNGRSDKGLLLTSKVCPQGVLCPCPGAIYMYKIIKNVYKIRFRRDHFEICNTWTKRKTLSVVIKILSPMDCLSLPRAICLIEPPRDKTNKIACAPSEDSDQPRHPHSLIKVFTVRSMGS